MGNRLQDYGFMNPFRKDAYLDGGGIDQWLVDIATYNNILKRNNISSVVEFAVRDKNGNLIGWTTTPPPKPDQWAYAPAGARPTSNAPDTGVMPEYRWKINGDITQANNELKEAGLQWSMQAAISTSPSPVVNGGGNKSGTLIGGAYIPSIVDGLTAQYITPRQPGRGGETINYFVSTGDPLGISTSASQFDWEGGRNNIDAFARTYGIPDPTNTRKINILSNPSFYVGPQMIPGYGSSRGTKGYSIDPNTRWIGGSSFSAGSDALRVAAQFFSPSEAGVFFQNPQGLSQVLSENPNVRSQISQFINQKAAYYRAKDSEGGGPLGVIAKGLSTAGMFSGLASGLFGALSGINALGSGTGLLGNAQAAFNAGTAAASSFPSLSSILSNITGLSPLVTKVGLGALSNMDKGLPGALLGAGSGAIGSLYGDIPGAIASGVGGMLLPQNTVNNPLSPSTSLPGTSGGFQMTPVNTEAQATPFSTTSIASPAGLPGTGVSPDLYNSAIQGLLGSPYGSAPQFGNYQDAMIGLANSLAYQPKLFDTIGGIGINVPGLQPWSQTA